MRHLIYCSLICCSLSSYSQVKLSKRQYTADSLKIVKPKLLRPQFKLDNRVTFFADKQRLSVIGVDAGILIRERLRLTLGYYTISDKLTSIKETKNNVEFLGQYKLNYGALNVEFAYKNKKR